MQQKESIVFINQNAGYLMIDMIHAQAAYKKKVLISGKLIERNRALDKSVQFEKIIAYNRDSSIKRIFTWTWGFIQIVWLVKTKYRKSDLFIVTNPPFACFIPLFCRNTFSLLVYDIYPDALVAYHFIGPTSIVVKWWKKANLKIFAKAAGVFTISDGMKKVLGSYIDVNKIAVVPIWTDNNFFKPVDKLENTFIQTHQLQDKFIVMYSGNLGNSHDIEVLIEIAAAIKDSTICFVIIGEGNKRKLIESMIQQYQLSNCLLLHLQEVKMLPYSLAAADLGVVTLGGGAATLSVPSKTFNLLSAGVPLLGIAGEASELASLVTRYRAGKCFNKTDIKAMIEYIKLVKSDEDYRKGLQQNALKAAADFGPENAAKFVVV
jgi:glycosyltransferase involved in cell wall biosynthesis